MSTPGKSRRRDQGSNTMKPSKDSMFSPSVTTLLPGRRKTSEVAFPEDYSESGSHNVGFVRMSKLESAQCDTAKVKMSVTPAANPPPLPPRKGGLPPLPPNRRVSAPPAAMAGDGLPPPPPRRNASLPAPPAETVSDFESRFRFHPLPSLPAPEPFSEGRRTYPSQMDQKPSRPSPNEQGLPPLPPSQPPPPPPPR